MIKTNKNFKNEIDCLANNIYNFYLSHLEENNYRIFAKDVNFKLNEADEYELNAFKKCFKVYFKTDAQFRKTKHIKSECLSLSLPDFHNNYFIANFIIYKDRYSEYGRKYLDDVFNLFVKNIEYRIANKNKTMKE
ncbi:hypothetical protein EYW75_24300 [Salmonella enterica subsp. enterica serovar Kentucky]|nr:hypothetical protein [Salmonella enterica subsp. enterica serovar Kentucky]